MTLSRDKQDLLESELEPGEQLLWSGEPDSFRVARQGIGICLFGVVWTAFTLNFVHLWWGSVKPTTSFWGMSGIATDLFFLLFLAVGLMTLLSPAWIYLKSAKTVYGISSKRVLIITGGKSRKIESYHKADLSSLKRVERADRSGDLTIAEKRVKDGDGDSKIEAIQFVGIPDVREVETILRNALLPDALPERL